MPEIYLFRHAQAFANLRDFAAFGNEESPLTDHGIDQTTGDLRRQFIAEFGFMPEEYDAPVLASEYRRPQQTAEVLGMREIHVSSILNESDVDDMAMAGRNVIEKHRTERWAPDSTLERADEFIDKVISGELDYQFFFTHGMFVAPVLLRCEARRIPFDTPFDAKRGYIPLQASMTKLILN